MRHCRVGQHALDVPLRHRGNGSDHHGQDRDGPQHRPPVVLQCRRCDVEQSKQRAECGDLGGRRHERGDGRGCALIDVGHPRVERHRTDLEQQGDRHQSEAEEHQGFVTRTGVDGRCDPGEAQGAGVAVQQSHAVEEECRREGTQQEVLQRGFLGEQPAPPGQAAHQIQRQREHLERDEHGQQVTGCGKQQHAADGEHGQREHLGLCDPGFGSHLLGDAARHRRRLRGEGIQTRSARTGSVICGVLGDQQQPEDGDQQDGALQE